MIKTGHELQLMKLANEVTLRAYEAAYISAREGMTQNEFAALVSAAHTQQGFQGGASVQVGENSALPHGSSKPGAQCQTVDAAARKVIVDGGYGPDYKFFTHRLGHGIGMDGHEWPYLVRGNRTKLAANMTFSDEPGIYIRGEFGVRLEDDMHITEDGAELFTAQSPSLEQPFGNEREA